MSTYTREDFFRWGRSVSMMFLLCATLTTAYASDAPVAKPLVALIAYSKAIAIGKVTQIRQLPAWNGMMGWHANAQVTVKVDKTLRGKVPDVMTAPIAVSKR